MKASNNIAYLLLYAANIDLNISASEKNAIQARLGSDDEWRQLREEFEKDSEYTRLEKVGAILKIYASPEDRRKLIEEVRLVMEADDQFSMMERYLLRLMAQY